MTGLRMDMEDGGGVAGGLAGPEGVLLDWRQDATIAASDCNAAKAMSMRPRRTVTSPL